MGYSVYSSLLSLRLELGPLSATNLSLQLLTTPETPPSLSPQFSRILSLKGKKGSYVKPF